MSARRHLIAAVTAALVVLWAPAAHAVPVDPATIGQPQAAPGCPDPLLDCTPPADTTAVGVPASGWFTTASAHTTLSGTDGESGLAGMEYATDGGDITSAAADDVVTTTGEGSHTLAHRALDVAGNASGWVVDSFGIDTVDPVNTTVAPDPAPQAAVTVTVSGTDATPGSGVAAVKWQLDGGSVQSGPSGSQVTISTDGAHTLRTWVVDAAGRTSAFRDDPVTIDAVKPVDTSVVSGAWRTTAPALVTLSGTDGGGPATTMEYTLDGVATVHTVPSGGTVSIGGDAIHSIKHRAVDAVGNASAWVTDTVRIDATAPVNTTVAGSAWRDPDQHVIVSGTDATSGVAGVQYQVDAGPIVDAVSGVDVLVTGEGTHAVRTQVLDVAGNASGWRTDTVKIDTLKPVDQTSPPVEWQKAAPVVQVSGFDAGSGVASVEWNLDGGATTTVPAASTNVTVSGDGQHTLRTRVTDALGHQTGWKSHTIKVDLGAPSNTTEVPPTAWQNGRVAVALAGADGVSGLFGMEWIVDGGAPQDGPAGTVVAFTTDGTHTLQTRAVDVAGNASGWRSDTIRIDTVAPTDSTSVPATVAYGVKATIAGTDAASGIDTVEWKLDGVAGSGASPAQVPLGGRGAHTLEHRVLDKAGNASPWKTDTVTVDPALNNDTTPPVDTTGVPAGWSIGAVTVTVQGTDASTAVERVEWREDGGSPRTGASGSTFTVSGDGVHHFETRVVDVVGNATGWTDRVVRIDGTSPVDATAVPAWQKTGTVTLDGTDATSGVTQLEWYLDGSSTKQTGPAGTQITVGQGTHKLEHRVLDNAGNVSAWKTDWVKVDSMVPVDTTPAAPAGWQTSAWSVTPAGTDTGGSGVGEVQAKLDGAAVPAAAFPIVVDADGTHTLQTRVLDVAGNATAWRTQTVRIDLHAPADTTPDVPAGWRGEPWSGTPSADDGAGSGVTLVEYKLGDAGAVQPAGPVTIEADGETVLLTRATDAVGHVSAWRAQTVRIDRTPPVAALSCAPASAPTGYVCTAGGSDATSGLAELRWRRDGGPWQSPGAGGTFGVPAGTIEVQATDVAGLTGTAPAAVLAERVPPAPGKPTVRSRTVAVKRSGTRGTSGLLGGFELRSVRAAGQPVTGSADVRPLSLGAGRFRVSIRLRSGQLTAQRVRQMRFARGGYSPRMGVALSGVTKAMRAHLTVEQRTGGRWRRVAVADATLKP